METPAPFPVPSAPSLPPEAPARQGLARMRAVLARDIPGYEAAEAEEDAIEAFLAMIRAELRARRVAMGIDQTALGRRLGLGQSAVSKIETGRGELGLGTIARYAAALGLRPELLLLGPGAAPSGLAEPAAPAPTPPADDRRAALTAARDAAEALARHLAAALG